MTHIPKVQQESPAINDDALSLKKVNYYQSWGVFTPNCRECYFVESDHTAFNEGLRYSVFDGSVVFSGNTSSKRGGKLTTIRGSGADINLLSFLADTYRTLDICDEEKCKINLCTWAVSISKSGSKIVIMWDTEQNKSYVVEQLM